MTRAPESAARFEAPREGLKKHVNHSLLAANKARPTLSGSPECATIEVKDRVTPSWVSAHPAQAAAEINRLRALLALEVA